MKRFLLLGVLYLLIGYTPGLAQALTEKIDIPKISPVSPEAAALARYINYPVSYHTGLPQINIPLFEIKLNDFTLPITLSYHAGGYKVNDRPGWVGMGWTLNAEPTISRRTNNIADEKPDGYFRTTKYTPYNKPTNVSELDMMAAGTGYDSEPDDFYYTLPTVSGAFVFTRTSTGGASCNLVKYPYTPVDIAVGTPWSSQKFEFVLKDAEGHTYDFVKADGSNLEYTGPKTALGTPMTSSNVSAWKANKITTRNNQEISFSYFPESSDDYGTTTSYITILDNGGANTRWNNMDFGMNPYCERPPAYWLHPVLEEYTSSYPKRYEATLRDNRYVEWEERCASSGGSWAYHGSTSRRFEKITFPGGQIIAEKTNVQLPGGTTHKIKSLTLKNNKGEVIKRVNFYQSPYNYADDRWLLDSIVITDSRNVPIERYAFTYNSPGEMLPELYRGGPTDYFGYYSQSGYRVDRTELEVYLYEHFGHYNAIVNPDVYGKYTNSSSMNGVLKRINYPTGGYTEFEYESNKVRVEDSRYPNIYPRVDNDKR